MPKIDKSIDCPLMRTHCMSAILRRCPGECKGIVSTTSTLPGVLTAEEAYVIEIDAKVPFACKQLRFTTSVIGGSVAFCP